MVAPIIRKHTPDAYSVLQTMKAAYFRHDVDDLFAKFSSNIITYNGVATTEWLSHRPNA